MPKSLVQALKMGGKKEYLCHSTGRSSGSASVEKARKAGGCGAEWCSPKNDEEPTEATLAPSKKLEPKLGAAAKNAPAQQGSGNGGWTHGKEPGKKDAKEASDDEK